MEKIIKLSIKKTFDLLFRSPDPSQIPHSKAAGSHIQGYNMQKDTISTVASFYSHKNKIYSYKFSEKLTIALFAKCYF
jgi:hypothetical protein